MKHVILSKLLKTLRRDPNCF